MRPVVEGILLDEGHVWKAVSVEASRLPALGRDTQTTTDVGFLQHGAVGDGYSVGCRRTTMRVLSVAVTQQMGSRVAWNGRNEAVKRRRLGVGGTRPSWTPSVGDFKKTLVRPEDATAAKLPRLTSNLWASILKTPSAGGLTAKAFAKSGPPSPAPDVLPSTW